MKLDIIRTTDKGEVGIKRVNATITDDSWEDGTYFIAGKLDEVFPNSLHLITCLRDGSKKIGEYASRISENSPYFDILFRHVPEDVSVLKNVSVLLVSNR